MEILGQFSAEIDIPTWGRSLQHHSAMHLLAQFLDFGVVFFPWKVF